MAGNDGELIFDTSIDRSGFEKGLEDLERTAKQRISAMAETSKSQMDKFADTAGEGLSDAAESVKTSVAEMGVAAEAGFQKIAEAAKSGVDTAEKELTQLGDAAEKGVDGAEKALGDLGDTVEKEVGQASEVAQKDFGEMGDTASKVMQRLAAESKSKLGEFSETAKREIGEATEQLKKNEQEAEYLQVKLGMLESQYAETANEVEALTQALRQSAKEKGIDAKETKELEQALDQTKKAKANFKAEIKATEAALKQNNSWLQRNQKALGALKDTAASTGKSIAAVGTALVALVEGTEDFRNAMTKLEQNGKRAGASMEALEKEMKNLYGITGDVDTSVEALSNLLSANFTGNNLQRAVEELSGAIIRFPDTLTIESLADGLQETLATGSAVGQYGELLERLGVDLERFNADLAAATTEAERQNVALTYLSQNGLSKTAQEYRAANKDQIAYKEAQFELQKATSELAKKALPLLASGFRFLADNLDALIPLVGTVVAAYGAYKIAAAAATIQTQGFTAALASNQIGAIVTGITALIGGIAAVTTAMFENRSEADKLIESYNKAKAEREASIAEAQTEGDAIIGLSNRLSTLVDANGRVTGSKAEVSAIVGRLKEEIPDLALAYDEETNSINMTSDAVLELAKAEAQRIMMNRQAEALADTLEDQIELRRELEEAEKRLTEVTKEYNAAMENGATVGNTVSAEYRSQRDEVDRLKAAIADNEAEVSQYGVKMGELSEMLYGSQAALQSTEASYQALATAAGESMSTQIDYFNQGAEASKTSAKTILENLKKQKEYYQNYSENLNAIMESGITLTEDLYAKLLEGGTESVALAAALADDIKNTGGEMTKDIVGMSGQVEAGMTSAQTSMAIFGAALDSSLTEAGEVSEETGGKVKNALNDAAESVNKFSTEMPAKGKQAISNMSEGVAAEAPQLSGAVGTVLSTAIDLADVKMGAFHPLGLKGAGLIESGMKDGAGGVTNAAATTVEYAQKEASHKADTFHGVGDIIAQFCADGVSQNTSVVSAVQSMIEGGRSAAMQAAPDFVDASMAATKSLIDGFTTGSETVPPVVSILMTKAKEPAEKASNDWNLIGGNFTQGMADGMNARSGSLNKTVRSVVNAAVQAAKIAAGIHSPSKRFRDEIGLQMGLGVALGLEDSEDETTKAAQELAEKTFSTAQKWIDDQKLLGNLTGAEEAEVWDEIAMHYAEGTRQRIQAEQNAAKIRKQIEQDSFAFSKNWIAEKKQYNELSLAEELAAWERVQARYAEGTEERKEAEQEIYRVRQEINDRAKEIIDDYIAYQQEKYAEIEALEQSYQDSVKDRANQIMDEFSLFEAVDLGESVSSDALVQNLKNQVQATESFYSNLDELTARGVNADLIEEIRKMGVGASRELEALLGMSDDQLQQYSDLYGEKQRLANEQALKELEPLREEIDGQISTILADIDQKFAEAQEAGQALTDGIAAGIRAGESGVISAAIRVANEALRAMKSALQIQSPSKRFRDEVGAMMAKGVGMGFEREAGYIQAKAVGSLENTIHALKSNMAFKAVPRAVPMSVNTTTNINKTITQNGTIRLSGPLSEVAELLWEPLQEYAKVQGGTF